MTESPSAAADSFLVGETLRVYARYQTEFVEALNLCPWARRASSEGQVDVQVALQQQLDMAPVLTAISALTADHRTEIGLLLFPRLDVTREQFERWVSQIVTADGLRMDLRSPAFALAAFHPQAKADTSQAERLVPFVRRTPDPTIQLVRISALERVRKGDIGGTHYFDLNAFDMSVPATMIALLGGSQESLRERISNVNLKALERFGMQRASDLLDDIAADRARVHQAYQRLLSHPVPPTRGQGEVCD